MRCISCDVILSEAEDRRKFVESGTLVQLCAPCAEWVNVPMTPLKEDQHDDDDGAEIFKDVEVQ